MRTAWRRPELPLLAAIWLISCGRSASAQEAIRFTYSAAIMGTEFRIVVHALDRESADRAAATAMGRGREIDSLLSDYRSSSEISQLSQVSGTDSCAAVSPELLFVLKRAQRVATESDGAFDVTIGPLSRLWRWAMRRGQLPSKSKLDAARTSVGFRHLHVDSLNRCVRLNVPDMQLDLGGIAKGYAADEMLKALSSSGFSSALVDAGGDIVAGDKPPDAPSWIVDSRWVTPDGEVSWKGLPLSNGAVATSGDRHRYLVADGIRYSHLLDPRTGMGLTQRRHVTVVAPSGIVADALASAISVMGPDGLFLADRPGFGARIIESNDDYSRAFEVGLLRE